MTTHLGLATSGEVAPLDVQFALLRGTFSPIDQGWSVVNGTTECMPAANAIGRPRTRDLYLAVTKASGLGLIELLALEI